MQSFGSFQEVYAANARVGMPSVMAVFDVVTFNVAFHGTPKDMGEADNIEHIRDKIEDIEDKWSGRVRAYELQRAIIETKALKEIQRKRQEAKKYLQNLKSRYDDEKGWLQNVIGLTPESDIPELDGKWSDEKWLDD